MSLKIGTVFSGVGAPEVALKNLDIPFKTIFACDNGDRVIKETFESIMEKIQDMPWDKTDLFIEDLYKLHSGANEVQTTYMSNHASKTERFVQDIRFLSCLDELDILIGGSPCQSFSIAGLKKGFKEERGQLFFEYIRIVQETTPNVFIFENVPNILKHDQGKTWEIVSDQFNQLDYHWSHNILNAKDYGLPQNRKRLFVVAFKKNLEEYFERFIWPLKQKLNYTTKDFLQPLDLIDNKYYLPIKGFERCLNPKNRKYLVVNSELSRCQVATQQYNWYGDMRFEKDLSKGILNDDRIHKGFYKEEFGAMRTLTPRECFNLMGFPKDFQIPKKDKDAYRQSGNSIAVPVIQAILDSILKTEVFSC